MTPAPVTPSAQLDLRLTRPHLVVRLLDVAGAARTGKNPAAWALLSSGAGPSNRWPERPVVHVLPAVADDPVPDAREARDGQVLGPAEVVYDVEPGRYLVGATGAAFDGSFQAVDVRPDDERIEVELRATAARELGTIEVSVQLAETGREPASEFDLFVERPDTAAVVLRQPELAQPPFRFELLPGAYRLVAEGRPDIDDHHGTLWSERELGRVERDVVVRSGETVAIDLEFAADSTGRLDVELSGESNAADREAVIARNPPQYEGHPDLLEAHASHVRLELRRPGRRPELVAFQTDEYLFGPHVVERLALGSSAVSERLPTGRYELVARLPGGREVRRPVELSAAKVTSVVVAFE